MEVTNVILVFGPLMPMVVGLLKMIYPNIDPRMFSLGYSVLIAVAFGLSVAFVGEEATQAVLAEMGTIGAIVFGIGTGLYKIQK